MNPPYFRQLRAYSFDPSLSLRLDTAAINHLTYKIEWEPVASGPVGEYVEVIDYDPTVRRFYLPVDLNDRYLLAQNGLEPSESNPQFHQQMVYAVTMTTIKNFEQALGRKIQWAQRRTLDGPNYEEYVPRLRLYPHAMRDANAYYSPLKKAVLFGYFSSTPADDTQLMPDSLVFTCLSHDIIAHEVTHAILDGIYEHYSEPTNPDVLAFHEAFADIVALFQRFTFPEVLRHQIARTRGDLTSQNLLGELAQQFGTAIGGYGGLRDAIGRRDPNTGQWQPKEPNGDEYRQQTEPHARGSILVAAVFEAFLSIYKVRIADLLRIASGGSGILAQGELHPDLVNRLAAEAAKAANHVLTMCIRALDYCPPLDITFGDFLRALITADVDSVRDDRYHYRLAFIDAFRRRGIYPRGIKTLSVESLRLSVIGTSEEYTRSVASQEVFAELNSMLREYAVSIKYQSDRAIINAITRHFIQKLDTGVDGDTPGLHQYIGYHFAASTEFASLTGLAFIDNPKRVGVHTVSYGPGPSFQLLNLRLVSRVGPDGLQINHVVFYLVQRSGVCLRNDKVAGCFNLQDKKEEGGDEETQRMQFRGGCTLILDLDTMTLKYVVRKPLLDLEIWTKSRGEQAQVDAARAERQYLYMQKGQHQHHNAYTQYFGEHVQQMSEPFAFLHQH
ncbi:hypothetical protein J0X19_22930 [Hymenobacter sp. BT186]|uniref:Peptidase S8 n=1 Tax=Hymenobacter telluris TaxID=2816474 RepID=A0A939F1W8_9BACT|nr:hypothetical protein [Hymenobacter telluris]MBO0360832.1 hypothetical protein [Hymenobacter telluris]MBW3376861.1 hypothetical protein [Hymenobacter norwichensis]